METTTLLPLKVLQVHFTVGISSKSNHISFGNRHRRIVNCCNQELRSNQTSRSHSFLSDVDVQIVLPIHPNL
jgi:hypothetical protein